MRIFYTDGSFGASAIKAGGWSMLEVVNGEISFEKWDTDFSVDVTSNKMEMRAAIEALKMIKPGESATINSDSQYVVKGMNEWIFSWQKNKWKTSKKEPVLNQELWFELLAEAKDKNIKWVWVRGHSNDRFNNRVDELAKMAYLSPEEIVRDKSQVASKLENKSIIKPDIGSLIYFQDESKRYIVMLNDVNVGNSRGFLAKLFANLFGNELEFFNYDTPFKIVDKRSEKETKIVFKAVEQLNNNIVKAYTELKNSCKHNIRKVGESACCSSCGRDFGWHCSSSQDKCCHYFSDKGKVKLITGEVVNAPEGHEYYYETYDSCIFCGEPEERK